MKTGAAVLRTRPADDRLETLTSRQSWIVWREGMARIVRMALVVGVPAHGPSLRSRGAENYIPLVEVDPSVARQHGVKATRTVGRYGERSRLTIC